MHIDSKNGGNKNMLLKFFEAVSLIFDENNTSHHSGREMLKLRGFYNQGKTSHHHTFIKAILCAVEVVY